MQVGQCIASFLTKLGDAALPYVEVLMPQIVPLLDKNRSESDQRVGICIIDDILDYSEAGRQKYAGQVTATHRCRALRGEGNFPGFDDFEKVGLMSFVRRLSFR